MEEKEKNVFRHAFLIDGGGMPPSPNYAREIAEACGLTIFDPEEYVEAARARRDELGAYVRDNPEWVQVRPLVYGALREAAAERRKPGGFLIVGGLPRSTQEADWLVEVFGRPDAESTHPARRHEVVFLQLGDEAEPEDGTAAGRDLAIRRLLERGDFYHSIGTEDARDPRFAVRFLTGEPPPHRRSLETYVRQCDNSFLFLPTPPFSRRELVTCFSAPARPEDSARAVQLSLEWSLSARKWRQFCGTHPVSLTRQSIVEYLKRPGSRYVVSAKLDGTRYFLLTHEATMWFIDRNTHVWQGPRNPRLLGPYDGALLDVELCYGGCGGAGGGDTDAAPLLYVVDAVAWGRRSIRDLPLEKRLQRVAPLVQFLQGNVRARDFFRVEVQEYAPMNAAAECVKRYVGRQREEEAGGRESPFDGLVFTPSEGGYALGRSFTLLKWKPPRKNTVDLQLRKRREGDNPFETRALYSTDCGLDDAGTVVGLPSPDDEPSLYETEAPIVECCAEHIAPLGGDPVTGRPCQAVWRYVRLRADKNEPNVHWVVNRIVDTLSEGISCDEILSLVGDAGGPFAGGGAGGNKRRRSRRGGGGRAKRVTFST